METVFTLVEREIMQWPGIEKKRQRFGSTGFWVNGHELGHIHGNWIADLPFEGEEKAALITSGIVTEHHVRPDKDWVTYHIRKGGKAEELLSLLRRNYERYASLDK